MKNLPMIILFSAFSQDIIADGVVDEQEVKDMRAKYLADGVIDREEANELFEINDAVSGNANHPSYEEFFIEAISSHLLEDEDSPGVIDEAEGDWLVSKIEGDGEVDALEKRLLLHVNEKATGIESSKLADLIATATAS